MNLLTKCLTTLVTLGTALSQSSAPASPCPSIFNYEADGSEPGKWYGHVLLSTDIVLHGLWLNIILDDKADILGNWVGYVTTNDNKDFKIENTTMKIIPGPAQSVRFFVQYNQNGKIPRMSAIRLNGREICSVDNPIPGLDRPVHTVTNDNVYTKPSIDTGYSQENSYNRPSGQNVYNNNDYNRPNTQSNNYPTNNNGNSYKPVVEEVVYNKPKQESRPIYTQTVNPPISETNAKPFSVGGGSVNSQNVGIQTKPINQSKDKRKPAYGTYGTNYEDQDDYDLVKPSEADYFSGDFDLARPTSQRPRTTPKRANNEQCGKVQINAAPLVVYGKPTLAGQWPWHIALYQTQTVDNKYICGGTLVSRNHVITAAHCVTRKSSSRVVNKSTLTVYLGKHNLRTSTDGVQIKFVSRIFVHPEYNATSYDRDVGVLRLSKPADITDYVRPACLWPKEQSDLSFIIGKKGSVVGWGFDENGVVTEELTLAQMPVVEQQTCIWSFSDFFSRFTSEHTYCAGFLNGTSVCNGDSGGGMVFQIDRTWYLRGLVSLSVARQNEYRCDPSHYVVFTDLAKFLDWIHNVMSATD